MGNYTVEIDTRDIRIWQGQGQHSSSLKPYYPKRSAGFHPHIDECGRPNWGPMMQEAVNASISAGDANWLIENITNWLEVYIGPRGNPYHQLPTKTFRFEGKVFYDPDDPSLWWDPELPIQFLP
jgi:hypothetical protein